MQEKQKQLHRIYADFYQAAAGYIPEAACGKGCAFCCTDAGRIDIITLEGIAILEAIAKRSRPLTVQLKKALDRDRKRREQGKPSPCPFLQKNHACTIYEARPFACRRIYSIKPCSSQNPPMLSRRYMDLAESYLQKLQELDNTGYSGHISYILYMLESDDFRTAYLSGAFQPEAVVHFGKSHQILINRLVTRKKIKQGVVIPDS